MAKPRSKKIVSLPRSSSKPPSFPKNTDKLFNDAEKLYQNKKLDDAITKFQEIVEINPNDILSWHFLEFAYRENDDEEHADDAFDTLSKIKPITDTDFSHKGHALLERKFVYEAMELFENALQKNRTNYLHWYNVGTCNYQLGQYKQAIRYLSRSTELCESFMDSWDNLGLCYFQLGDFHASEKYFSKGCDIGLENKQDIKNILNNRAWLRANMKKFPDAKIDMEKAFQGNEKNDGFLDTYGFIYFGLKNYEESWKKLDACTTINPNNDYGWFHKGLVQNVKEEYDLAIQYYDKAISLNPNFAEAYNAKAVALEKLGRKSESLEHLKQAIQTKPSLFEAHHNLTKLNANLQKNERFWEF